MNVVVIGGAGRRFNLAVCLDGDTTRDGRPLGRDGRWPPSCTANTVTSWTTGDVPEPKAVLLDARLIAIELGSSEP